MKRSQLGRRRRKKDDVANQGSSGMTRDLDDARPRRLCPWIS